jgi:hypothetical protein
MANSNIQSINSNEENQMTALQQLFQQYVDQGGKPAVTHFRLHLNKLIDQEVKHLCGRSSKSGSGDDWRSEVNARFGGRGAKWVFVSLDDVKPTLDKLDSQGIDTLDYRTYIEAHGQAWVRYTTARMHEGKQCAGFAILTDGSTINKPTQLHFIPVDELEARITPMNSTPHAMKLEEAKIVVQKEVSPQDDETPSDDIELEEEIEEINEDNF